MSLAYDFVVASVIVIVSVAVHVIAVQLFGPSAALHSIASGATVFNGAQRADLWYQILAQWVPMGGLLVAGLWPIARAFRRQASTTVTSR